MISIDEFKPVTLAEKDLFRAYFKRHPPSHTEYLFTTFVAWNHYTPAYYLQMEGDLLLMTLKDGVPHMRPPLGERNTSVLRDVLAFAKERCGPKPIVAVDEAAKDWIGGVYPGVRFSPDRDFFDYVYLAADLAKLPGKGYMRQRTYLNRFRKLHEYSVEKVSPADMAEIDAFLTKWCMENGCDGNRLLEAEVKAAFYCIEHFKDLGLSGIVIRMGGQIKALSVYEPLNDSTVAIHIEKALQGIDGLYPAINNEAAKALEKDFTYINRESDMGIAGLRTAKERLNPHHMEKVYSIENDSLPVRAKDV